MDYIRKKRWANYHSLKCKLYLRNDFNYECAYCKLHENDIDVIGEGYFEKDHFQPQSNEVLHDYSNMVYACKKCNNNKDGYVSSSFLNPCIDDIYSGVKPHIINSGRENGFVLTTLTEQGKEFIEQLKLNSRYHINLRRKRAEIREINENIKEQIRILESKGYAALITDIRQALEQQTSDIDNNFQCGSSRVGEIFVRIKGILDDNNIENEILLEEYNIDFKIDYDGSVYYCEVIINSISTQTVNYTYIPGDRMAEWNKNYDKLAILYYYEKTKQLFLFIIPNEDGTDSRIRLTNGILIN